MGNSPSTSRITNPSAASQSPSPYQSQSPSQSQAQSQSHSQHESPRPVRRDNRHPIPVHNHRVAIPPEPSLTQAQGTAVQPPTNSNRPKPMQTRMGPSVSNSSSSSTTATSSAASTKPVEVRPSKSGHSHEPAKPVAVPTAHHSPTSPRSPRSPPDVFESTAMAAHNSLQDLTYLTRPPRLPLPIEEEVHTPGSPIIAPADIGESVDDVEGLDSDGGPLARPPSNLSNTSTINDEEDTEELRVDKSGPTVPTRLEWLRGGDKVYVTGTIFQWNRKTRLHPVEGRPGAFAVTINILPGTHHVRFLVDGQMQTSPDLPTTVDFGNNLVNYIEVNPDDLPSEPRETSGVPANQDAQQSSQENPSQSDDEENKAPKDRIVPPPEQFTHKIPRYLVDFDQPEDTPAYHNAITAIDKLPTPPALPGFLGKPILNAATLIKDDNSVLNMPNHTVLNHLATSSIKNNILAVSATTRYKSKYVTTIMYKPTTTEGI
ncbi:5'-AMP-activated protein kinase beta subunit, interation domain-containing protein [Podospora appendiculata]|uniref:5'-AMP-activated protein kinase beta subunit, interation domain-containing protein n=1 Tax=Podospora appendiculata TaxID=314037 RepID=A0AAE0X5Y5_9PEZI|nr:5'-AMP-activated protein kinase beta subunit, interation domain-containing protein [Podospora appendiculata]